MKTSQLIRINEVAERLGVSVKTVRNMADLESFPAKIKVGKFVCFDESEIEAWLECKKAGRKYIQRKGIKNGK